ncbi:MAG TPA: glycine--tRNA ligase [Candidatus Pacebacteria bacterium]|nr:MAG: Glycine-tRNA ligase [Microgenomates group bacterium GW2011_GWB1_45_17]KKU23268.1 MAG: Glycine-tRNA ligase [Microgenomates group bacterium GW2011_GWA1_46_15]KKU23437.1 MAG: glycyl-tRNA synthetase, glycyl-tRNA synthetase [Microgenomates group bacterium GW2011_GWC1_46_15]HAV14981.1 glycine--tRNA ligase [Candidatus Paceibacterota bacterium]HCR11602.1 glycine--tRNA ligase [Candidatus Paceibacterota bacterium]
MSVTLDDITALAKRRGFVFQSSELYGGLANLYDYGPMGTALLRNIRNLWWKTFVDDRDDMVGLDASTISHAKIWEASGHVAGFADAMIDCKSCHVRMRADHLIEDYFTKKGKEEKVEGKSLEELDVLIAKEKIPCPTCGKHTWTTVRKFNLLFPVHLGILEESQSLAYLRGETAQGMFVNFKNVLDSTRVRLPFGVAQLGKSFRNEITKGNFVFRTLEFEQGEIEYFFDPEQTKWETLYEEWKKTMWEFVTTTLGVNKSNLRWRAHTDEERSFYSKRTEDLEYNYPFGYKELWGLAYRTDYDLSQHIKFSGKDLSYTDPQSNKKFVPHVIEPAVGINRLFLMVLADAYWKDEQRGRIVLKLNKTLAPYRAAVFPLVSNKPEIVAKARSVYTALKSAYPTVWDDRGNIGKRYLAQDEIGTPFCVTIDYQTLEDNTVTVRNRDTAEQQRVKIDELKGAVA